MNNFRNYSSFEFEPDPSLTILVGPNGVGKTNLLEAVELMTEIESFRRPLWSDVIKEGSSSAHGFIEAAGDSRNLKIELSVNAGGKREYRVNGKNCRSLTRVAGILPCVLFTPDDLRLVKASAEKRRGALASLGSQLSPSYMRLKSEYERILRQRNSLLRDDASDNHLDPWTENLVQTGALLLTHRMRLFTRLAEAMGRIYPLLTGGGELNANYVLSWEKDGVDETEGSLEDRMMNHLKTRQRVERARRTTISGPHRDEIVFQVEGREARAFASQGQQRTVALAWKLAEVAVITEIGSQKPVLLLDDVMSELDEGRRYALASFVGSVAQTIMTTTNLGYFDDTLLGRAKVVVL